MLALLALPATLRAQIVAVDAGVLHTSSDVTEMVAELYLAAPPWQTLRPYAIVSWTPLAEHDPERPTVIAQVAFPFAERGRFWSSIDSGVTLYPFRDYRADWSVSAFAGFRLPWAGLYLFAIPSTRPAREWERSLVAGVGRTLWFRR
jgi:hypothetical protein